MVVARRGVAREEEAEEPKRPLPCGRAKRLPQEVGSETAATMERLTIDHSGGCPRNKKNRHSGSRGE